jgi:hypothetical protein
MSGGASDIRQVISLQSWQVVTTLERFDYHFVWANRLANDVHHGYRIMGYPNKNKNKKNKKKSCKYFDKQIANEF